MRKHLGEDIDSLKISSNMRQSNGFVIICFANIVTIDFNVLCPLMKNRICGNLNGTGVVSMQSDSATTIYCWKENRHPHVGPNKV